MTPPHTHRFLEAFEERLIDLETRFHDAYWHSQVDASPANERRRAELELELRRLKGDPGALESVQEALSEDIHEPVLKRSLEVLRLSLTANQMEDSERERIIELDGSIESDYATHRPDVAGRRLTENDIEDILHTSEDLGYRRAAWEGSKEIGRLVAGRVLELVRLRNQVARRLGFADFYRMSLQLQEIDEDWLFGLMDELEALTDGPFKTWKNDLDARLADRFGTEDLRPWHYADPFFQSLPPDGRVTLDRLFEDGTSAPELARRTFSSWGIDLSRVLTSSDLFPREGKCQHAFCLHVDRRSDDVRILANVVPGERWVEVMLHESGHAAYDVSIDPKLPYLLRRHAHIFVTESIALLCGRMVRNPLWLQEIAGVPGAEVEPLAPALARADAAQSLLLARWVLVVVHFERLLYSDPEVDLSERWWDLVERFQLVARPEGRSAPDWAAKIHIATAPAYYQNYLLGELLALQLEETCERECGGIVGVPAAGELLKDRVFKHGALMPWHALVEGACGEALSPQDFAARVALGTQRL